MPKERLRPPSPLEELRSAYQGWMRLPEDDLPVVDLVFSTLAACRLGTDPDPVWAAVLGPPGTVKTEAVLPLLALRDSFVFPRSSLSSHALTSGYIDPDSPGTDFSFLTDLQDGLLLLPDFTTMMTEEERDCRKVMGVLRAAYDGIGEKQFGTGVRGANVKFGLLLCATPVFYHFIRESGVLGHRFLCLEVGRKRHSLHHTAWIINAARTKHQWRGALRHLTAERLGPLSREPLRDWKAPKLREDTNVWFAKLGEIVTLGRTLPGRRDVPEAAEQAARFALQLTKLCHARAWLDRRRTLNQQDYELARRVAVDTLPPEARTIIKALYRSGPVSSDELLRRCPVSDKDLRLILRQYRWTHLVEKTGVRSYNLSGHVRGWLDDLQLWPPELTL